MGHAVRQQKLIHLEKRFEERQQQQQMNTSAVDVIGAEHGLKDVIELCAQVAPLTTPVLLLGETGVGKEVLMKSIHQASPRKDGPLVTVNCGAIPESLLDSELFGHERDAFTGASGQKRGYFERAHHGTIFLDEIGELPLQAQVRLLRVLQEKEIERVGGSRAIPVDIRVMVATHRNLAERVAAGQFREDLWFRINVFPIVIPPLRQRKEDIPAFVRYFIDCKAKEMNLPGNVSLAPGAIESLQAYDWPGNVRELQNLVERALIQSGAGPLHFDTLLPSLSPPQMEQSSVPQQEPLMTLDEVNSQYIRHVLHLTNGKISGSDGAAELLRFHPNTLRKRMDKLHIPYKRKSAANRPDHCQPPRF